MTNELNEKTIETIKDLFGILDKQDTSLGVQRYYFRGESNSNRPLLPKLIRETTLKKILEPSSKNERNIIDIQSRLLQRLKRYALHIYDNEKNKKPNHWEWICVAQHHGLPTLLLDWSINPLVSLYFSCLSSSNKNENGCLYVMQLRSMSKRDNATIRVGHHHNDDIDANMDVQDAKKLLIVIPLVFTRRIESQASRFLYMGNLSDICVKLDNGNIKLYNNEEQIQFDSLSLFNNNSANTMYCNLDNKPWKGAILKYVIPSEFKEKILKELRKCQIHEGTIFSDLDGYARYLGDGGD